MITKISFYSTSVENKYKFDLKFRSIYDTKIKLLKILKLRYLRSV